MIRQVRRHGIGRGRAVSLLFLVMFFASETITFLLPVQRIFIILSVGVMPTSLRPKQNCRNFLDDIFKCIFLNDSVWISIAISLKFVPKVPINNIPAIVQIVAWRWPGNRLLSEPIMVTLPTHICVTRPQWVKSTLYSFESITYECFNKDYVIYWTYTHVCYCLYQCGHFMQMPV